MSQRNYTAVEIDVMRRELEHRYVWGYHSWDIRATGARSSRSYTEKDMCRSVEEQLRTYIAAGIDPIELTQPPSAQETNNG